MGRNINRLSITFGFRHRLRTASPVVDCHCHGNLGLTECRFLIGIVGYSCQHSLFCALQSPSRVNLRCAQNAPLPLPAQIFGLSTKNLTLCYNCNEPSIKELVVEPTSSLVSALVFGAITISMIMSYGKPHDRSVESWTHERNTHLRLLGDRRGRYDHSRLTRTSTSQVRGHSSMGGLFFIILLVQKFEQVIRVFGILLSPGTFSAQPANQPHLTKVRCSNF